MSSPAMPSNSTNVRKIIGTNPRVEGEPGRVLALAVTVWGAVIAGAGLDDTFGKFAPPEVAAFAAGIALYALMAYRIDRDIRARILQFTRGALGVMALLTLATLLGAIVERFAALAVFVAPLAAVSVAAAVEKTAARATTARAKSPAGNPAAT